MKKITIAFIIISSAVFSKNTFSQSLGADFRDKAYADIDNKKYQDALGDINKAMPYYENDDKTMALLYYNRAFALNKLERYESAVSAATNAITMDSKLYKAYVQRGKAYLNLQDYKHAIDDASVAITHIRKDDISNLRSAYVTRSSAERHLNEFSKSIDDCNKLISFDTEDGQGYWERGITFNASGEYEKAIKDYTSAMAFYTTDESLSNLYDYRATSKRHLDNYAGALADDSICTVKNPLSGLGYWGKAATLKQMEKYKEAIDYYTKAIAKYSDNKEAVAKLYVGKASCEQNLLQYADAVNDINTGLSFNPDHGDAYWIRGYCNERMEKYNAAIDDATSALKYYAKDSASLSNIYCNRGHAKILLNMFGQGIADYKAALSANPNTGKPHWLIAHAYQDSGLYQQAIDEYTKALDYYKNDEQKDSRVILYSNIGFTYYRMKNYQQAVDFETKSINFSPSHTYSYCIRGRSYLLLNKNEEALADFKKALQLDTTDDSYIYSLFFAGDSAKAFSTLKRKMADPATNKKDLAQAYYDIACLYSLQNNQKESLDYLRKSLDAGHSKYLPLSDPDLENVASTPEFKELFN